jgi:iron complex transport system substrate-binding protein
MFLRALPRRCAPELITALAVAIAVFGIELRRATIHLTPEPSKWITPLSTNYPRVMRDSSGNTLTIVAPPRRLVSQTLGSDELLFGVCASNRLVGVSPIALDEQYSNVADQIRALALPTVESVEGAVELRPDIVFVASYSSAEQVELLRSTGIVVFRLSNFDDVAGILRNIRAVGYAVGEEACAAELASHIEARLGEIRTQTAEHKSAPRVMLYGTSGYTAGANTLIDEMFRTVGARNVAAEHGVNGSVRISTEVISLWQPDFIVSGAPHGESEKVLQSLMSDPAIANSRAGRSGRILVIDDRYLLCVSQYIIPAIEQIAEGLYSDQQPHSNG